MGQAEFSVWVALADIGGELVFERVQHCECQYSSSTEFVVIGQYIITMFFSISSRSMLF